MTARQQAQRIGYAGAFNAVRHTPEGNRRQIRRAYAIFLWACRLSDRSATIV